MIEIKNLTLQRGLKVLLDQAALSLAPGRRVGLIGKNGSGKSSLFALLKGEITADKGDVSIPKHWKTAAVAQETRWTYPRWIMFCRATGNCSFFRRPYTKPKRKTTA